MPDRPKIGPTGTFPFGQPRSKSDRGGLILGFRIIREPLVPDDGIPRRVCEFVFGTDVGYFELPPEHAMQPFEAIRTIIKQEFPDITHDKTKLEAEARITVTVVDGMIRITLPTITPGLVANPHVFLAMADQVEDLVNSLKN